LKTADQCCGDLEESLTNFVTQFQNLSGITIELAISPAVHEFSLAEEAEVQLLRIIQEALTNIRKHAATDQARVTLTVQNGALELTVSDNGRGFDPAHTQTGSRPHFGLGIMRERAKAVGAEFTLTSEPGAGTRVAVRLPLEEN
ncbi:MAG: sensor histidine kinase, partial [Anaerolineae bacterium]